MMAVGCGDAPEAQPEACTTSETVSCVTYATFDAGGNTVFESDEFPMSLPNPSTGMPQVGANLGTEFHEVAITARYHDGRTERWAWKP